MMFEFKNFNYLTDGEIDLVLTKMSPEDKAKNYVPSYEYKITLHGQDEAIGGICIRIGNNQNTYYGGHIGYGIDEAYRGNAYAAKACRLIVEVAKAHQMERILITCNPDNYPSRRTCEKVGLHLLEIVDLPSDNEMYLEGEFQKCIYEWIL